MARKLISRFGVPALGLGIWAMSTQAATLPGDPTTAWRSMPFPAGVVSDYTIDQQTGSEEGDIVGAPDLPAIYIAFNPGNSPTNGSIGFRMRVGKDSSPAGFKGAMLIGIDADLNGTLDLFAAVDNSGSADSIAIYRAGNGANISPSTTTVDSQHPIFTYPTVSSNYNWSMVTSTMDPAVLTSTNPNPTNLDGAPGIGETDYFLSFFIPFSDLVSALQAVGISGVTTNTRMHYLAATSTQANSLNQDINGFSGIPANGSFTNIYTPPLSADGSTNHSPVAVNDTATTPEDTAITINPLANDSDADGDPLSVISASATDGTVQIVGGTNLLFQPATNFNGTATINYTISDGNGGTGSAMVTVTVTPVNDAPIAYDDGYGVNKSSTLTVSAPGVLGNDTDVEDDPLTAVLVSNPLHGTLTLNTNGGFAYTPVSNYFGADSFTYKASDGVTNSLTATVTLTITNINHAPAASADAYTLGKSTSLTVIGPGVLGNDVDADGDGLTALKITDPGHGAVTLNADGGFTYTPASNYFGADSFTYQATDGLTNSLTTTVSLTITNINHAPSAIGEAYTLGKNTTLTVSAPGVLGNDIDADGDALTAVKMSDPAQGTLSLNTNGGFIYSPNSNYFGADSFTYRASDGVTNSPTVTVTFTITNINRAPVANADAYSLGKNTALTVNGPGVLGNDTDADGDPLTALKVSDPTHGTVTMDSDGGFTYTPVSNYFGADSFTYQANDGLANSTAATVSLAISNINRAPIANGDSYTLSENTNLNIAAPGVLANDSDADGDPLTAVKLSDPAHGTVSLNTNGGFTYTPASNYFGADSFTYQANDGSTNSLTATVSFTINPGNRAPVANNDSYTLGKNTPLVIPASGILGNDTDADSDPLSAVKVSDPSHGAVALNANGGFTYTPASNYFGADSFTYQASDGVTNSLTATVSFTITNINRAPVANSDGYTLGKNTPLTIAGPGVLGNDTDADGDALTAIKVTDPAHGTLSLSANGGLTYTPASNYFGADSFTYQASDGLANSLTATVSFTITNINRAPIANGDAYTLGKNTPLTIAGSGVLGNDTDADGDALTAIKITDPGHGTLSLSTNGGFTYTPASNFFGADSFTYQASDGLANSLAATVSFTITNINRAPIANGDAYTLGKNTPLTIAGPGVLSNDTDADGDALAAIKITDPGHGTLSLSTNGGFTYTPASNYFGVDSFTYQANDGLANSTTVTVSLSITNLNRAPTANGDSYTLGKNTPLTIAGPGVLGNDTDADGDPLAAIKITDPGHGTLSLSTNGGFTYTPASNYFGADSFTYQASDGAATSFAATVSLSITNINRAPVANPDAYTLGKNTALTISGPGVLSNDTDADGDALAAVKITDPAHGTLALSANGGFVYSPASNYFGADSFTYRTSDGLTNSLTVTVSFTITNINRAPVANNDAVTSPEDVTVTIHVLANDVDADGDPLGITSATTTNGTLSVVGTNLVFTPATNFNGAVWLGYSITDSNGGTASASVLVTVTPVYDPPIAVDDTFSNLPNALITIPFSVLLPNDYNPDPSALTVLILTNGARGTIVATSTNLTYQPPVMFTNTDVFRYVITDTFGASSTGRVSLVPAPPQYAILVGLVTLNHQTGLYEQHVTVTNIGSTTVRAVRLCVGGIVSGQLINTNPASPDLLTGLPFVQNNASLDPGSNVVFLLEYFDSTRRFLQYTNLLYFLAKTTTPTTYSVDTNNAVAILGLWVDRRAGQPRLLISFSSTPGGRYTIIYSDDVLRTWQAATPTVTATAALTQWYDDGPPKTVSSPFTGSTNRFYRVILNP